MRKSKDNTIKALEELNEIYKETKSVNISYAIFVLEKDLERLLSDNERIKKWTKYNQDYRDKYNKEYYKRVTKPKLREKKKGER